jgi:hypothetical protein
MNELQFAGLKDLEIKIETGLKTFIEVGLCLLEIRDRRLYKEQGYSRFEDYCQERWGWKKAYVYRQIEAAKVAQILSPTGDFLPNTERQVRELAPLVKVNEQEALETWQELKSEYGDNITSKIIRDAVQEKLKPEEEPKTESKPHIAYNSGNNEWYTPSEYIEAARNVMGRIELDPALSELANETVQSGRFFSIQDNGLKQSWSGKVWMNPPYASELIGQFCNKLSEYFSSGDITEAIALVNNATETTWFNTLIECASAIVFPKTRVKFRMPNGETGAPLQGQAVIYFGDKPDNFMAEFKHFGWGAYL